MTARVTPGTTEGSGTGMIAIERGMVMNGLDKKSIADCLQTRPIDYRLRLSHVRGRLEPNYMKEIAQALKVVFSL